MPINQSFCFPLFRPKEMSRLELFREAKAIGYAAVEFWGRGEDYLEILADAAEAGLVVASMTGHASLPDGLNKRSNHDRIEEELRASIDIAAECGLSKGSLYWYFSSKKELFLYLFSIMMDQTTQVWEQILGDETLTPTEKLRATLEMFGPAMEEWLPFFGVMLEAWGQTRFDEDVEELMASFYKPYIAMMTQILQEGLVG